MEGTANSIATLWHPTRIHQPPPELLPESKGIPEISRWSALLIHNTDSGTQTRRSGEPDPICPI